MKELHFNFKDLFRAARIGFSLQRIWVNGTGLLSGFFLYLVISYVSLLVGGYSFGQIWSQMGLLPCAFAMPVPWYGTAIYLLGLIVLFAFLFLTNTAVSRVVYMNLRDELFYTWTQAYKFAFRKWISSLGSMFTFLLIIIFFVIAALVMGLIGRIPFVGELGTALMTIPYIFAALLLFFIILAFMVAIFFVPAIIATSDEDALGGVFQSFSITFNQPWRIIIYTTIVGILEVVGFFLFAVALKVSYFIFMDLFRVGMGDKILEIQQYAFYLVDNTLPAVYSWLQCLPGDWGQWIYLASQHPTVTNASGTIALSGYIVGIFMLILGGAAVAYAEAIGNSGLTIIYIILYKLQERENLLEREDEELKEEEEEEEEDEETPKELEEEEKPKKKKSDEEKEEGE
jgi:hypothetical protein